MLTEGLLLRRELVEEWVGGGTHLALLLKGGLLEDAARHRQPLCGPDRLCKRLPRAMDLG